MAKGFEVKVVGQYVARSGVMGKERIIKDYEITCVIPNMEAPLSIIKNKILGPKLQNKYEDYCMFRTYHIIEINPLSEEDKFNADMQNIRYMSRQALVGVIRKNALPVPQELYPNLFKLREAVQFAMDDPDGYEKHLDLHRDDLEMDVEVASLNPDIAPKEELGEVNEPKPSGKAKKTSSAASSGKKRRKRKIDNDHIKKQTEDRVAGFEADMRKDGELGDMDEDDAETELENL